MDTGKPTGHAPLLIKAAEILGGEDKLRAFLRAPPGHFERWITGKSMLPVHVFLKLADLVSERNQEFISKMTSRQDELRKRLSRSSESIAAGCATLARSQPVSKWSIVLRAGPAWGHNAGPAPGLKHRLFEPSFVPADRAALLDTALDATLEAAGTDMGNVQLIDADGALRIERQRGFATPFLDYFSIVSRPECACGVAMSLGRQVFIPDVRRNSMFMGTDAGRVLESAGCEAVLSSPLVHDTGVVLGMISTHYRKPCPEHQAALASAQLIAERAASWLALAGRE